MSPLTRFFGGEPKMVLLKLIALSVLVGVVLTTFGLNPYRLLYSLERLFGYLVENIADIGYTLWHYFLLGAAIVVPIWLIMRLFSKKPPEKSVTSDKSE